MVTLYCVLIFLGIVAMLGLPQLENKQHKKIIPFFWGVAIPVIFILLMVYGLIKHASH